MAAVYSACDARVWFTTSRILKRCVYTDPISELLSSQFTVVRAHGDDPRLVRAVQEAQGTIYPAFRQYWT